MRGYCLGIVLINLGYGNNIRFLKKFEDWELKYVWRYG